MKHGFPMGVWIGNMLGVALLGMVSAPWAAPTVTTYDLSWNAIAGGGATFAAGGSYSLGATIGQPATGPLSGASYALYSGFWTGSAARILDIDGNGTADALTDGLLIIRYLFGSSGTALTSGAIGAGATRSTPADVQLYLDTIKPLLDVDGDVLELSYTDGLMLVRYLFGLRGSSLTAGAVGSGAPRTAPQVEAYIQSLMP